MALLWNHCQIQRGTVGWHVQWMDCRQVRHFRHETESVQDKHECYILVPILAVQLNLHCVVCCQEHSMVRTLCEMISLVIFNIDTVEFRLRCVTFCVNVKTVYLFGCCFYCKKPKHLIYYIICDHILMSCSNRTLAPCVSCLFLFSKIPFWWCAPTPQKINCLFEIIAGGDECCVWESTVISMIIFNWLVGFGA